jgi:Tol biopolymer transport system component
VSQDNHETTDLYSLRGDGRIRHRLTTEDNVVNVQFSPDGRRLMFESQWNGKDWAIYTMNLDGSGRQVFLQSDNNGDAWNDPSWSPDGTSVAVWRETPGAPARLVVVDLDTKKQTEVFREREPVPEFSPPPGAPTWSPDGRRVAFLRPTEPFSIWVVNADGRNVHARVS